MMPAAVCLEPLKTISNSSFWLEGEGQSAGNRETAALEIPPLFSRINYSGEFPVQVRLKHTKSVKSLRRSGGKALFLSSMEAVVAAAELEYKDMNVNVIQGLLPSNRALTRTHARGRKELKRFGGIAGVSLVVILLLMIASILQMKRWS